MLMAISVSQFFTSKETEIKPSETFIYEARRKHPEGASRRFTCTAHWPMEAVSDFQKTMATKDEGKTSAGNPQKTTWSPFQGNFNSWR